MWLLIWVFGNHHLANGNIEALFIFSLNVSFFLSFFLPISRSLLELFPLTLHILWQRCIKETNCLCDCTHGIISVPGDSDTHMWPAVPLCLPVWRRSGSRSWWTAVWATKPFLKAAHCVKPAEVRVPHPPLALHCPAPHIRPSDPLSWSLFTCWSAHGCGRNIDEENCRQLFTQAGTFCSNFKMLLQLIVFEPGFFLFTTKEWQLFAFRTCCVVTRVKYFSGFCCCVC